mmetsp:Transcript_40327/g.77091  ORF Transcript_40327/g.77091 Transcript_40327/m.77091 type:complete len:82 (+) Transcript_40327:141-386(+)
MLAPVFVVVAGLVVDPMSSVLRRIRAGNFDAQPLQRDEQGAILDRRSGRDAVVTLTKMVGRRSVDVGKVVCCFVMPVHAPL